MNPKQINTSKLEGKLVDVSDWFSTYVQKRSIYCKDRFKKIQHPLVASGKAFWVDDNTICVSNSN